MKQTLKQLGYLLLLTLCFNCLNASAENEEIEKLLLKQIDEQRMAYKLYTELYKTHPEVKILKGMIAAKKENFSTLVKYAEENHPDLRLGQLNGTFKVRETGKLYDEWLKQGNASSKDAVEVGIELEEWNVEEIGDFLKLQPQQDLAEILNRVEQDSKKNKATFRRQKTRG